MYSKPGWRTRHLSRRHQAHAVITILCIPFFFQLHQGGRGGLLHHGFEMLVHLNALFREPLIQHVDQDALDLGHEQGLILEKLLMLDDL